MFKRCRVSERGDREIYIIKLGWWDGFQINNSVSYDP